MDLNYLYHRRGISLARALDAACARARSAHLGLYEGYGAAIDAHRKAVAA